MVVPRAHNWSLRGELCLIGKIIAENYEEYDFAEEDTNVNT